MPRQSLTIGLPEERVPDLKHRVLNWLTAEPEVGRRFRMWLGPACNPSQFVLIVTAFEDDYWIMWDVRASGRNDQYKVHIFNGDWPGYVRNGTLMCEDRL